MVEVVAALIAHPEQKERYLVARRATGEARANRWEFPGGKIQEGESHTAALARELKEELDVGAQIGPLYLLTAHEYDDVHIRLWTYLATIQGEPQTGPGHSALDWMTADEMLDVEFSAADLPVVRAVRAQSSVFRQFQIFD